METNAKNDGLMTLERIEVIRAFVRSEDAERISASVQIHTVNDAKTELPGVASRTSIKIGDETYEILRFEKGKGVNVKRTEEIASIEGKELLTAKDVRRLIYDGKSFAVLSKAVKRGEWAHLRPENGDTPFFAYTEAEFIGVEVDDSDFKAKAPMVILRDV